MEVYDELIVDKLGDVFTEADVNSTTTPVKKISAVTPEYEAYEDDQEKQERMPELDDFNPETYDAYVQAQVQLPVGDQMPLGMVLQRKRTRDGNPIGRYNNNPILDTCVRGAIFRWSGRRVYAANLFAENLYLTTKGITK
jgi:hypothetical protein